jgi:hypothetical protein
VCGLVKLFRKKEDQDTFDILREAFAIPETPRQDVGSEPTEKVSALTPSDNPQITTITKTETIKVEQKEVPEVPVSPMPKMEMEVPEREEITEEDLRLLMRVAKAIHYLMGKEEITKQLKPLVNPDNLQTMSRLSDVQVEFVSDAHWLASQWRCFEPLRDLAHEICETEISAQGKGRQEVINFMGSLTGGKLLKGLTLSTELPSEKKRVGLFRKKEGEESGEA